VNGRRFLNWLEARFAVRLAAGFLCISPSLPQVERDSATKAEQQAVAERDTATRNFKLAKGTADSLVLGASRPMFRQ
jgi:hypothetical protein